MGRNRTVGAAPTRRAVALAAAFGLVLAACSGSSDGTLAGEGGTTTIAGEPTTTLPAASTTSVAATSSSTTSITVEEPPVVVDVEPAAYFVDIQGSDWDAAEAVLIKVTLDGKATELWRGKPGEIVSLEDVSADGRRVLMYRGDCSGTESGFCELVDRDVVTGTETINPTSGWPEWERRKARSSVDPAVLQAVESFGEDSTWTAVTLPEGLGALVSGKPMTLISPGDTLRQPLGNTEVFCSPTTFTAETPFVTCLDKSTRKLARAGADVSDATLFFGGCCKQIWDVPLDGGAPRQLSRVRYKAEDAAFSLSLGGISVDAEGRQWLKFYFECGGNVAQLNSDGSVGKTWAGGYFAGAAGDLVITSDTYQCFAQGQSTIYATNIKTGKRTVLYASSRDEPEEHGVRVGAVWFRPKP